MQKTITKLPKSQMSIKVSLPAELFESYRAKAVAHAAEHIEIPGFRKGKAPVHMVEAKLVPMAVLEEMADLAVNDHFPKILVEEKIDAIGRPAVEITKLAKDNPLEFTITVAVMPQTKLPDYKKLAAAENAKTADVSVTDEELTEAIKELKKRREHDRIHRSGEEHDHNEFESREFTADLTDEEAKQFGPFESADAFREKYRENIKLEKEGMELQKRRIAILEAIAAGTETEVPDVLVESELEQLIARLKADIAQAGISFEDYLNHIKKSEADLRSDLAPDAEKRAKMELIMAEIAKREEIKLDEETVENETKRLIQTYQDADPLRARAYVTHLLMNEEIFKFLEAQK